MLDSRVPMTRICSSEVIPEGEYRVVTLGERSLLLARIAGRVHAVENLCGHQTRRMDGGALRTEPCIVCPHHAMWYDLRDGHVVVDAGHLEMEPVKSYETREEDGAIWIALPA